VNALEDPDQAQPRGHGRRWQLVVGLILTSVGVGLFAAIKGTRAASDLASILGTAIALVVALFSLLIERISHRRASSSGGEPTVAARINDATRSLEVAAGLVNELQTEMQARMVALERLQVENAEYEKLTAVRKEEAEAVSRLIEAVISSTHTRLSRSSRRDQVLFFVAGLAASIPVQIVVNLVTR
jgi:hypothetical protein